MTRKWLRSAGLEIRVVRILVVAIALLSLAGLLWQLTDVLLLIFAAVLVATILHSLADLIAAYTPLARGWALLCAGCLIAGLFAAFLYLLGAQVHAQASDLVERLPELLQTTGERLGVQDLEKSAAERLRSFLSEGGVVEQALSVTSSAVGVLGHVVLVLIAGVYLAIDPRTYRDGLVKLFPARARAPVGETLDTSGRALKLWLIGQLVSMSLVGTLTAVGLWALGVPSALALGLIAGLAEFIPLVGPIASAAPALMVAMSEGTTTLLWVAVLYVAVQQIESNMIMPLVQRQTVDLPPVVSLFAILAAGVLFGPLGVLLATPLSVVLSVALKKLYVSRALGERTSVPGDP